MYSTAIVLSLLAGSVLSQPHAHNHIHARQVKVVDVVDVYTTVTIGQEPTPPAQPVHHQQAAVVKPEEKFAEPQQGQQWGQQGGQHWGPPNQGPPAQSPAPVVQSQPPANTPTAPASNPSGPTSGNDYLDLHNQYRGNHGAKLMTWSSDLASKAQNEVNGCPSDDVQSGSNWYGSSGGGSAQDAVNAWYGEMGAYASETNNYASNPPSSGGADTGHFSQMIWDASTSLGCAMASSCGSWKTQVICLYEPAGNMVFNGQPQYTENVFPPKS